MTLRVYKFQIVAVCQEIEDGQVVGERIVASRDGQPLVVFGLAGLHSFADEFEKQLNDAANTVVM